MKVKNKCSVKEANKSHKKSNFAKRKTKKSKREHYIK